MEYLREVMTWPGILLLLSCVLFVIIFSNIFAFYKEAKRCKAVSNKLEDIPCPIENNHWLLGSMKEHPGPTEKALMWAIKWMEKYPKYYALNYGRFSRYVVLNHPQVIKLILKTSEPKILSGLGWGYRFLLPWLGDGLLVSSGAKWFRNRRLLTPGFHFDILKPYVDVYNQAADAFVQRLTDTTKDGGSIEMFQETSLCTLNIILRCAFSRSADGREGSDSVREYSQNIPKLSTALIERIYNPLHHSDKVYYITPTGRQFANNCKLSHKFTLETIRARKKTIEALGEEEITKGKRHVDFLDILLLATDEDGAKLKEKEILDEVETFMFEGHDTTKSAICFFVYNLAWHPAVQEQVRDEVNGVLEGRESDDILWSDFAKLPYLTQCMKESFRLHPPVPLMGRQLTRPVQLDGHTLPVDTPIEINVWNLHHNPTVWGEDHMTYDPERFSADNMANMDAFAYIPFSAGPRNCIGQIFALNEVKVIVAKILRYFQVSVDESLKVELVPDMILRTANGIRLHFKRIR